MMTRRDNDTLTAADYVDTLQAHGRHAFTVDEAVEALGRSDVAVRAALRRLKQRGVVATPCRGFYVVVPPPYRHLGCLPAELLVPDLMQHLEIPYYVGLLSAARYHGAAHQTPMVYQVIVPKARRPLTCKDVRVQFVARRDMAATPVIQRNTDTGVLRIATSEATALEIVGYPSHCGYLDNVATVLGELVETLDAQALEREVRRAPVTWGQRLGYLFTHLGFENLADAVAAGLAARTLFPTALAPWRSARGCPRDPRWRVAINVEVKSDL